MSRLAQSFLIRANARRSAPFSALPPVPHAYAEWEWAQGAAVFRKCYAGHIDLAGTTVLDLACGLGGKTLWLGTQGPDHIVGLDIDPAHIAAAEHFLAAKGSPPDIQFVLGDAGALPFPDHAFEIVITSDSVEHFTDPGAVLREIRRVLAPGGALLIDFAPWQAKFGPHLQRWIATPWAHWWCTAEELEAACRAIAAHWQTQCATESVKAEIATKLEEDLDHFRHHVTHISLAEFRRLLAATGPWVTVHRHYTGAYPWAWPLAQLGWDPFIGRMALILRKPVV